MHCRKQWLTHSRKPTIILPLSITKDSNGYILNYVTEVDSLTFLNSKPLLSVRAFIQVCDNWKG